MAYEHPHYWCSFVPNSFLLSLAEDELVNTEIREVARATAERDPSRLGLEFEQPEDEPEPTHTFHIIREHGLILFLKDVKGSFYKGGGPMKNGNDPELDTTIIAIRASLRRIYDFFEDVFGHDVREMRSEMTIIFNYGKNYADALWTGDNIILGSGKPPYVKNFALDEDVLAHEITHAVIKEVGLLENAHESGALFEHLADVFAVMHKQRLQAGNRVMPIDKYPWTIGDSLFAIASAADAADGLKNRYRCLRSLKDPQAMGHPAHWDDYRRLYNDNGGVHHNCGIPSHAFYIAATDSGLPSWEGVGQVWYKAMMNRNLGKDCTFARFAAFTLAYAENQGIQSIQAAIESGWRTVGVDPDVLPNAALALTSYVGDEQIGPSDEMKAKMRLHGLKPLEFDRMKSKVARYNTV